MANTSLDKGRREPDLAGGTREEFLSSIRSALCELNGCWRQLDSLHATFPERSALKAFDLGGMFNQTVAKFVQAGLPTEQLSAVLANTRNALVQALSGKSISAQLMEQVFELRRLEAKLHTQYVEGR